MIGRDRLKTLRTELGAAGCDMARFRRWQRTYEKIIRQLPSVRDRYENALAATQDVQRIAQEMERLIVDGGFEGRDGQKRMAELFRDLKRRQGTFFHEFIVSSEDREVSSTCAAILSLGVKALGKPDSRLILQSEVENLLELLKENLGKERPSLIKLSAFSAGHDDRELAQLPPAARLEMISDVYEKEFLNPVESLMSDCLPPDQVQKIMEEIE